MASPRIMKLVSKTDQTDDNDDDDDDDGALDNDEDANSDDESLLEDGISSCGGKSPRGGYASP